MIRFPQIPLLKGRYFVTVFLACERGLHVYDVAPRCIEMEVTQSDVLQGLVALPHEWVRPT
jgi:lipopolysaccharide transport system ATP-binding protein